MVLEANHRANPLSLSDDFQSSLCSNKRQGPPLKPREIIMKQSTSSHLNRKVVPSSNVAKDWIVSRKLKGHQTGKARRGRSRILRIKITSAV